MNFILFKFLFVLIGFTCIPTFAETIKISHIDSVANHRERIEREISTFMPTNLIFKVETDDGNGFLRLTKVPLLTTYFVNDNRTHQIDAEHQNRAVYTDRSRKASIIVDRFHKPYIHYTLDGNFEINERFIHIKPGSKESGTNGTINDHYIVNEELMIDESQYDIVIPDLHHRGKRAVLDQYTVEVCFITDYKVFQFFYSKNNNNLAATRTNMKIYYAHAAEQMKIRYEHFYEVDKTFDIQVVISGLVIIEQKSQSMFSEGSVNNDGVLDGSATLKKLTKWLIALNAASSPAIQVPLSDHYMLFTRYEIRSSTTATLGIAPLNRICVGYHSVSIVKDGIRNMGRTTAHELGHSLGANHDGDHGCSNNDVFVLSEGGQSGMGQSKGLTTNNWKFSACTRRVLKASLKSKSCLKDNRYGDMKWITTSMGGKYYDKTEQCKNMYGSNAISTNRTLTLGFCIMMICERTTRPNYSLLVTPLEKTECASGKWCIKGSCVSKYHYYPNFTNLPKSITLSDGHTGTIYTVTTSAYQNRPLTYKVYWSSVEAEELFSFNPSSGIVQVKSGKIIDLTKLTEKRFALYLSASDGTKTSPIKTLTLNTELSFSQKMYTVTAYEGLNGTYVATLRGKITDSDGNTAFTYSLSGTNSAKFAVRRGTIVFNVDYNLKDLPELVTLTVTAVESRGDQASAVFKINIKHMMAFTEETYTVSVKENVKNALVARLSITHRKRERLFTYRLSGTNADKFTIRYGHLAFNVDYYVGDLPSFARITVTAEDRFGFVASADVVINIIDVNQAPSLTILLPQVTLMEGVQSDRLLSNVRASDPDKSDTLTFDLWLVSFPKDILSVDQSSGAISVIPGAVVDYESLPKQNRINVRVSDGVYTTYATLTINILDSDEPPKFTNFPTTVTVKERTADNIMALSSYIHDPERAWPIRLQLKTTPYSERFSITPLLNNAFRFRDAYIRFNGTTDTDPTRLPSQVTLVVVATDRTNHASSATTTINIENVNQSPKFINKLRNVPIGVANWDFDVKVDENTPPGVPVYDFALVAEDPDSEDVLTYRIGHAYFIDRFEINGSLLMLKEGHWLDFEAGQNTQDLSVLVSDGQSSFSGNFHVYVQDVNEAPVFNQTVLEVNATDGMAGMVAYGEIYKFVNDPDRDPIKFSMKNNSYTENIRIDARHGFIYYVIDYYLGSSGLPDNVSFVVVATDVYNLSSSVVVNIRIKDINQKPIIVHPVPNRINIPENTAIGTVIYTLNATDPDGDRLRFQHDYPDIRFPIDIDNGAITLNTTMDFETGWFKFYRSPLKVYVMDNTSTSTTTFTILVADVNEPPVFDPNQQYSFSVREGRKGGVVVSSLNNTGRKEVYATDPEGQRITYSLAGPSSNRFIINQFTGKILFAVDYDADPLRFPNQVDLIVVATDTSFLSSNATLNITIKNVNKFPSIIGNLTENVTIAENTTHGTVIFTVSGSDLDSEDVVEFRLFSNDVEVKRKFAVNASTGEVYCNFTDGQPLDYDTRTEPYMVKIYPFDGKLAGDPKILMVYVTDINEPPKFDASYFNRGVHINRGKNAAEVPVVFFNNSVTDPENTSISFSLLNGTYSEYFEIEESNGTISYASGKNLTMLPKQVELVVRATDASSLSSFITIPLKINEIPTFTNLPETIRLSENMTTGDVIFTVSAVDADEDDDITFDWTPKFSSTILILNNKTGEVTVGKDLKLKNWYQNEIEFLITVNDGTASTEEKLIIVIKEKQDNNILYEIFRYATSKEGLPLVIGILVGFMFAVCLLVCCCKCLCCRNSQPPRRRVQPRRYQISPLQTPKIPNESTA